MGLLLALVFPTFIHATFLTSELLLDVKKVCDSPWSPIWQAYYSALLIYVIL